MNPFEDLITHLSERFGIPLHPDANQSCLITFPQEQISIQIDLDTNADQIIVGSELGRIVPGSYRERIFVQAMRTNGGSVVPRGILAFSEKNDTLILFQYLSLASLDRDKLFDFLQLFLEHAKIWKHALDTGDVPIIEEENQTKGSGMFGLKP